MRIGFIDCEKEANRKNKIKPFPNIPLMKLSAWHKLQGDSVEWYSPMFSGHLDIVYVSKVFSFTEDYPYFIDSEQVIYGGSGYAISMVDGKEIYNKEQDKPLPQEIEHIYPDYELYGIKETAYGFITRGCPRGCEFCHVKDMQGRKAQRVASLHEFWNEQKNIVLLDPNITACAAWKEVFQELIDSKANVDFSQGLDLRMLNDEKVEMLMKIKCDHIHFAWDRIEDEQIIIPKLKWLKAKTNWDRRKIVVYCLVGDRERKITESDLKRIYTLREIGCYPYVMIYNKESLPKGHELLKLQRWVNNRFVWEATEKFEDYGKVK